MSTIDWKELREFPKRHLDLHAAAELAKVEALRRIAEELYMLRRHVEVHEQNNLLLKIVNGALDKNIEELDDRGKG